MFVIKELRFGTHYGNVPNPLQATCCPPFLDKLRLFRAIVIYSVSAYTVQFEFVVFLPCCLHAMAQTNTFKL